MLVYMFELISYVLIRLQLACRGSRASCFLSLLSFLTLSFPLSFTGRLCGQKKKTTPMSRPLVKAVLKGVD